MPLERPLVVGFDGLHRAGKSTQAAPCANGTRAVSKVNARKTSAEARLGVRAEVEKS